MEIYSLGLGPGDPELITLKAKRVLDESDIVVVPQSSRNGRSIAKEIVAHYVDSQRIYMYYFPMNNNSDELNARYGELALKIKTFLEEGKKISYVTIGDPTIFSTSNYLTKKLKEMRIKINYIPGISSVNALSSRVGVPLCIKGEDFGVYELPEKVEKAVELIKRHPATVFLKVNKKLSLLIESVKHSTPSEAYLVKNLGLEGEEIYNMLNTTPPPDAAYLSAALIKQ